MKFFVKDTRKQFWRFYELYELYTKADGHRQLTFDDFGYIDDIDVFLTGCISQLPIHFVFDGSTKDWRVLSP